MGRVPDAIAKLEGLLQSAPDRVETWFTLGSYYSMVGRIDESVAAYENFLTLVPDLPMFAELRALAEDNLAKERPLLPESATEVSAP
jgi:cytochrome c-type biogenesis protein CcmH/NrfG